MKAHCFECSVAGFSTQTSKYLSASIIWYLFGETFIMPAIFLQRYFGVEPLKIPLTGNLFQTIYSDSLK